MTVTSGSYKSRCVADVLELGYLNDHDEMQNPAFYHQLYQHARNEDGKRVLFENDPSFSRGWINLDSDWARSLISVFVPLDEAEKVRDARKAAQANLEAVAWNDMLGINDPPIQLKIKIHGSKWGMRFQSTEPAMRGEERVNEELPPIPTNVLSSKTESNELTKQPQAAILTNMKNAEQDSLAEILKSGGMPI